MRPDLNETLLHDGGEAVRARLDNAEPYAPRQPGGRSADIARTIEELAVLLGYRMYDGSIGDAARYLVDGMIPANALIIGGGQSGAGKTFVFVKLALCLASGMDFFGRQVLERCGVIFVAAEGGGAILKRLKASVMHGGTPDDLPLSVITKVPDLSTPARASEFIAHLGIISAHMQKTCGVRVGAVIIDTISTAFALADENDNAEAARVCRILKQIGDECGVAVIAIHHYGKSAETGLRGASAWRANCDVVLSVLADRNHITGECSNRSIAMAKNRDGEEGPISGFELKRINVGTDERGEPIWSCAVDPATEPAPAFKREKLNRGALTLNEAFDEVLLTTMKVRNVNRDGPAVNAVPLDLVEDEFKRRYVTDGNGETQKAAAKRQAWKRALDDAIKSRRYAAEAGQDRTEWIWKIRRDEA